METFGFVYKITNVLNGKVYVGQTTQKPAKRWTGHKGASANPKWPIHRAIARYGADNFEFAVIEECSDRETLDQAEVRWIVKMCSKKPGGYNVTDGGCGINGYRFSAEACAERAERMRGRYVSPETGRKISASKLGKKMSEETCLRMALSRTGRKHSPQTREKIGAAHRGRKLPPEQIAKIVAARKGFRQTESARAAISRPVVAAGINYGSLSAAASELGVSMTSVQRRIDKGIPGYCSTVEAKRRRKRTPEQVERHRERISKPVVADGRQFKSATEAAIAIGISRQVVRYRLAAKFPGYAMQEAA